LSRLDQYLEEDENDTDITVAVYLLADILDDRFESSSNNEDRKFIDVRSVK